MLTWLSSRVLSLLLYLLSISFSLHLHFNPLCTLLVSASCSLHALCSSRNGLGPQWGLTSLSKHVKLPYLILLIGAKPRECSTHMHKLGNKENGETFVSNSPTDNGISNWCWKGNERNKERGREGRTKQLTVQESRVIGRGGWSYSPQSNNLPWLFQ